METRDILDYQGVKIGELELPDGTSEEEWASKLAQFAIAPPTEEQLLANYLTRKVSESRKIADEAIDEFQKQVFQYFLTEGVDEQLALLKSCWAHHRLRAVDVTIGGVPMTIDVMNLAITGSLETAWVVMGYMTPDAGDQPFHFFTADWIAQFRSIIGDKVGLG